MHRELGTKERDCSGPSRVVFEELWMNESLWWETLGHPLVLCTGLSPLLGNSPTSGCKMKLLAWTKCRTYSQEKRKGQAPAAEEGGRVKAWALCFLAKGEVFGTVRKDSKEGEEQGKGEVIMNSACGTEQPPDTLNSSQFGNATDSSFLCWASRARCLPWKCLKPELWLKMALWGWVGTAESLITPQSRQFKLCLQKWETPSGPGAIWGRKICHIWLTLSFQKVVLCGTSWGVFYELIAWLLRESPHPHAPSLSDVDCRWRVSILHRTDVQLWQVGQAVGAGLALGGTQSCIGCSLLGSAVIPGLQSIPEDGPAGLRALQRNRMDMMAFPYRGEFRVPRDCSDYRLKHCRLL